MVTMIIMIIKHRDSGYQMRILGASLKRNANSNTYMYDQTGTTPVWSVTVA